MLPQNFSLEIINTYSLCRSLARSTIIEYGMHTSWSYLGVEPLPPQLIDSPCTGDTSPDEVELRADVAIAKLVPCTELSST